MASLWNALLDLILILTGAFLLGTLFERLRQGSIVGYLLAGVVLGPSALGVVRSDDTIRALAEIGVALVLFSIGLEFSLGRLRRYGRLALLGGSAQILVTWGAGTGIAALFGADTRSAVAIGAALALSSTAVVLKVLRDLKEVEAAHGKASLAILLVQDVAVVPLVLVVATLGTGGPSGLSLAEAGKAAGTLILVSIAFALIMLVVLPKLLDRAALTANRELGVLLAMIACGGAAWAAHSVGVSPSIGAFLAGLMLAEGPFADQIRADVSPLKALFATLFFASIGLLADLAWVASHLPLVLGVTLLMLVLKAVVVFVVLRMLRQATIVSVATGLCLAQAGEFAFVLGTVGLNARILSADQYQVLTSATILSLLATPLLVRNAPDWGRGIAKRVRPARKLAEEERSSSDPLRLSGHVVQVGFGDSGRASVDKLLTLGYKIVVLEIDPRFHAMARDAGHVARLGDATQAGILRSANLATARALVIAVPDARTARLIIAQARSFAPEVPIVCRARYSSSAEELRQAGADIVIDEERVTGSLLGDRAAEVLLEDSEVIDEVK